MTSKKKESNVISNTGLEVKTEEEETDSQSP